MQNLLILISNLSFGGAEIHTLELANELIDLGYTVDIVVLDNKQDIMNKARPEISFHIMKKKTYLDYPVVKKLRNIIHEKKPDVTLCVNLYPVLYLRLALGRKIDMYRTATVIHSIQPRDLKEAFNRWHLVPMAKSTGQFIFVSRNQMEYWVKKWRLAREKCAVIHNSINIEKFSCYLEQVEKIRALKASFGFSDQDIILGTCANFRREKRHQDLVKACALLKEKRYPVKLLLIGDGNMRRDIENKIFLHGLANDAFITGFVPDVRPYLALVDIFVLTSEVEAFPIAALESQAMKKAAVLTNVGGASEIVKEGINGFLYPPGDISSLVEKLEKILEGKRWKAMGEAGYDFISENYRKEQMVLSYDKLFRTLK